MSAAPITVRRGLCETHRSAAAALYWAAFGAKLARPLGPSSSGIAFLRKTLDGRFAITAVREGELLGIAGFKTAEGTLIAGEFKDLVATYGRFSAVWRAAILMLLDRTPEAGVLTMDGIAVAPSARGRGVGTRLLGAIGEEAIAQGATSVRLDVIDTNPRAQALYVRNGFVAGKTQHLGPLAPLFGFSSALTMRKSVGPA